MVTLAFYAKKKETIPYFLVNAMERKMIIQTSTVHMSTEHEKTQSIELTKSIELGALAAGFFRELEDAQSSIAGEDDTPSNSILVITDQGMQFRTSNDDTQLQLRRENIRSQLFDSLIKAINPKYREQNIAHNIQVPDRSYGNDIEGGGVQLPQQMKPVSLQVSFKVSETIEEYECSSFSSCGKVTTADGQEIEFDLSLEMERSYSVTREFEMTKSVEFTDPLMVNFDGNYADLADEKFEFDLDADGDMELISNLAGEGGMLAIDSNGDGMINDGTELFGALSGNGFADLAQYDEDGNNYIDEADSIYDDLQIWTKTEEVDSLESIADHGIGAIYLGSTQTPFDIKGEDNQQNGRVSASGFYLSETGEVGTIQQVDMVV